MRSVQGISGPMIRMLGAIGALALSAAQITAQDAPQPRASAPPPPAVERLERFRIERLGEALELDEEQARALRQNLEEAHRASREAFAGHREAIERLRRELQSRPVERDAVQRALEALEEQRRSLERLREEHQLEMERLLTPEQRGKLFLFNRQFDGRLRELMAKRRAPAPGAPGAPDSWHAPRAPRGHDRENEAARIRRQIERLQQRLQEIERPQD